MTISYRYFDTVSGRAILLLCALSALPAAAKSKKPGAAQKAPVTKPRPAAPPVETELKVPQSSPEPAPVTLVKAPTVETPPSVAGSDEPRPHTLGLFVGAEAGVLAPLSVLTVGVRAAVRAEYRLFGHSPLLAAVAVGFERHLGTAARQFSPPAGGYDPVAAETQTVLAIELGATLEVWRNDQNAVIAGLSYGFLPSWSRTSALGSTTSEFGVGQQIAIDAGYTRHFGAFDVFLRGRWAVRHTASGPRTSTIEQPWYQALGLVAGAGFAL